MRLIPSMLIGDIKLNYKKVNLMPVKVKIFKGILIVAEYHLVTFSF